MSNFTAHHLTLPLLISRATQRLGVIAAVMVEDAIGVVDSKIVGATALEHVTVPVAQLEDLVAEALVCLANSNVVAADVIAVDPGDVVLDGVVDFVSLSDGGRDDAGLHGQQSGREDGDLHCV